MIDDFIDTVRAIYGPDFIPLHRPVFGQSEITYLEDCVHSNFVSSVGERVNQFEEMVAEAMGVPYAVATVNGTAALHIALRLAGATSGTEVVTQALTFVATANAIAYTGASPVFVDVDRDTMGMSPSALRRFFEEEVIQKSGRAVRRESGRPISACLPMHTFGHPVRMKEIADLCGEFGVPIVEDAAEALGSSAEVDAVGRLSLVATVSFNGNKLITTGGGGMLVTRDQELAKRAKHITTTAKVPHPWDYYHDELGFNYRLPNLNAALGCAQMERLPDFLETKKRVAKEYEGFFQDRDAAFVTARPGTDPNFWLNAVVMPSIEARDEFLERTNSAGVMTRPIWKIMSDLPMYADCWTDGLVESRYLQGRVVNIPSSVP